ncbi:MAG: calcium-binding protein [Phenylobacterium sp.]
MPLYTTSTDFTIYAGETLSGTEYYGLYVQGHYPSPVITVNGALNLTSQPGANALGVVFDSSAIFQNTTMTVGTNGSIRVTATDGAAGISGGWSPLVVNHGLIEITGKSSATGISISVSGGANGVPVAVDNSGVIRATSDHGALGVSIRSGGGLINSGTIEAKGGDDVTVGVGLDKLDHDMTNSGTIRASDTTAARDSIAVSLTSDYNGNGVFTNQGLAQGDIALQVVSHYLWNGAIQKIVNSGTLQGKVTLGGGQESLVNSGTITGDVTLNAGDDVYDGRTGTLSGVLHAGDGADSVAGGASSEGLFGDAGADTIVAGAGADTVGGGAGDDQLDGGDGVDLLSYEFADGRVTVDLANNLAWGALGIDPITGFEQVVGGVWGDTLRGSIGSDTLSGGFGHDSLAGDFGDDLIRGDGGADSLSGQAGQDTLEGGAGGDTISGGAGNDLISGGDGSDSMSGDGGNDSLTGGAGADVFHISADGGAERITDFNAAEGDRVYLDSAAAYTLRQQGADTVVDMAAGGQVTLANVQLAALPAGWITTTQPSLPTSALIWQAATTVRVDNTGYTLPEGEARTFTDQDGVIWSAGGYDDTNFHIAGAMRVVSSANVAGLGGMLTGISVGADAFLGDVAEVVTGGSIVVDTTANFEAARGVYRGGSALTVNYGEITVVANRDAYGFYSSGGAQTGFDLINAGHLQVTSQQSTAYGVYLPIGDRFSNSGLLEVHGAQAAYGVYYFQVFETGRTICIC